MKKLYVLKYSGCQWFTYMTPPFSVSSLAGTIVKRLGDKGSAAELKLLADFRNNPAEMFSGNSRMQGSIVTSDDQVDGNPYCVTRINVLED